MGNYSIDPQARLADATRKHYVAVRMQQAVPVLDADWNLLEDLRRNEFETLGSWFIGDGVPTGSDGFHVIATGTANDFGIRGGLCIVGGKLTANDGDTSYLTQPNFKNPNLVPPLAPLTTPPADKSFIVYLDVFEEEVDSQQDTGLVDARIGVESALRLKRNWAVRVARVPEDIPGLSTPPPGHLYLRLAQLTRVGGNSAITASMVVDLRDTQLSIKRKIEVRTPGGNIAVDNARFQLMLQNTRDNLLSLIRYIASQFNPIFTPLAAGETLGLQAADHIARAADAGLALVNSSNLANPGALQYMYQLLAAQENFLGIWRDVMLQIGLPKKYASYATFVQRLDDRLHLQTIGGLTGLKPALDRGDLAAAVSMQEAIATLFGTASASDLPRGTITVFLAKSPLGNLTSGQPAVFEFHVRSATTLADTYTVAILPDAGWPRTVVDSGGVNPIPNNKVPIGPTPAVVPIFVNVTVQTGSSGLQLRVTSDHNPDEISQTSNLFTLNEGQPAPPGEEKIQFSIGPALVNGTKDPTTGAINISRTKTCTLSVQVFNNTGQSATFTLGIAKLAGTETPAGSWTANYNGDPTAPINAGQFATEAMAVTPAANATSVQIIFTASATILGSTVSGQFVIPFVAVP
jgi:hypothetical protein